ncbi:MAG: hypothetical protein PHH87_04700 [Desulfuromonas sp.]|nr:hypothetical protein [Desulfuromonas sp.]
MHMLKQFSSQVVMALLLCATMLLSGCGNSSSHDSDGTIQMGGAIQGNELVLETTATFLGGGNQPADGYRTSASFESPYGITSDGDSLYVSEMYNNTIRKIELASGEVTTLAGVAGESGADDSSDSTDGLARFDLPLGITTDGISLYVCEGENNTIRRVELATGFVSTLAGNADEDPGFADGTGTAAQFSNPNSIVISADQQHLYVTDMRNHAIRQIVINTGVVTTLAGGSGSEANGGSADGIGTEAQFNTPNGIVTDGINLYVADTYNHTIRKIVLATAAVTTLAGSAQNAGADDGVGPAASFRTPRGLFLTGEDLYVVDAGNNTLRKVVTTTGEVTTAAGIPMTSGASDGIGVVARFDDPRGIVGVGGNLYLSDYGNNLIRSVEVSTPENSVVTFAGVIEHQFVDIATDGTNLYVSDLGTGTIQSIKIATGEMTTLSGRLGISGSTDGDTSVSLFNTPMGITTDGTNLYVCDSSECTIRQISIASGAVTTLAGSAGSYGSMDGSGSGAEFFAPYGITTDGTNLYVTDTGNLTIRQIVIATGAVTTLAGSVGNRGSDDGIGAAASFKFPMGITTDGTNLYVADNASNSIRQIVIATGEVTTLVSSFISFDPDGETESHFMVPMNITTDGTNLYVTDFNNIIHKIVIASAEWTTLAGNTQLRGSTDGSTSVALFNGLGGITTDGKTLYVLDSYTKIRSIR